MIIRGQREKKEERDSPVGAAFSRDLDCDFNDLTNRLINKGEWPSCLPISP